MVSCSRVISFNIDSCFRQETKVWRMKMSDYRNDDENKELTSQTVTDALKFVKENEICKLVSHNGSVFGVEPPLFVELLITECEPGVKGDTATGATKPCVVETGATLCPASATVCHDRIYRLPAYTSQASPSYNQPASPVPSSCHPLPIQR